MSKRHAKTGEGHFLILALPFLIACFKFFPDTIIGESNLFDLRRKVGRRANLRLVFIVYQRNDVYARKNFENRDLWMRINDTRHVSGVRLLNQSLIYIRIVIVRSFALTKEDKCAILIMDDYLIKQTRGRCGVW